MLVQGLDRNGNRRLQQADPKISTDRHGNRQIKGHDVTTTTDRHANRQVKGHDVMAAPADTTIQCEGEPPERQDRLLEEQQRRPQHPHDSRNERLQEPSGGDCGNRCHEARRHVNRPEQEQRPRHPHDSLKERLQERGGGDCGNRCHDSRHASNWQEQRPQHPHDSLTNDSLKERLQEPSGGDCGNRRHDPRHADWQRPRHPHDHPHLLKRYDECNSWQIPRPVLIVDSGDPGYGSRSDACDSASNSSADSGFLYAAYGYDTGVERVATPTTFTLLSHKGVVVRSAVPTSGQLALTICALVLLALVAIIVYMEGNRFEWPRYQVVGS